MIGGSYFGNTQWMAALSKPPDLKAIAPMITWSDPDDGLRTRGGVIELGLTVPLSLLQGADILRLPGQPLQCGGILRIARGRASSGPARAGPDEWRLGPGAGRFLRAEELRPAEDSRGVMQDHVLCFRGLPTLPLSSRCVHERCVG
jgi:hypothetical protein